MFIKVCVLIGHGLQHSWQGSKQFYKEIKIFFKEKFSPKKEEEKYIDQYTKAVQMLKASAVIQEFGFLQQMVDGALCLIISKPLCFNIAYLCKTLNDGEQINW